MTRERAAKVLAVGRNTVTAWMKAGRLEHVVMSGGYRRPLRQSVLRLMYELDVAVRFTLVVRTDGREYRSEFLTRRLVAQELLRWMRQPGVQSVTVTREQWSAAEVA
jgi:hypothetical protein